MAVQQAQNRVPSRTRRSVRYLRLLLFFLLLSLFVAPLLGGLIFVTLPRVAVDRAAAQVIGSRHEDVSFSSSDGVLLKGWLFQAERPTGRSVILVHGWLANRVNGDFGWVAKDMVAQGYDLLMFDLRGAGDSGGDHPTMGYDEQNDVLAAYDFMLARGYQPAAMTVFGVSMGGATVLAVSPRLPQVGAIVVDSAFGDLRATVESSVSFFVTTPLFVYAGLFNVNPDFKPIEAVRSQPERAFLFFHGDADRLVPVEQARKLRAASSNPQSELVIVAGATHTKTFIQNPKAYLKRLYQFLDQQLR